MGSSTKDNVWEKERWYESLHDSGQYIADLICKYHKYFSNQDKKYRKIVRISKVVLFTLAMISTIVLGIKTTTRVDVQIVIGLVLSALITFVSALSTYFNFEEYWMKNISIHIKLNILRDEFILEAIRGEIDDTRVEYYMKELNDIQNKNICYWEKAIKSI